MRLNVDHLGRLGAPAACDAAADAVDEEDVSKDASSMTRAAHGARCSGSLARPAAMLFVVAVVCLVMGFLGSPKMPTSARTLGPLLSPRSKLEDAVDAIAEMSLFAKKSELESGKALASTIEDMAAFLHKDIVGTASDEDQRHALDPQPGQLRFKVRGNLPGGFAIGDDVVSLRELRVPQGLALPRGSRGYVLLFGSDSRLVGVAFSLNMLGEEQEIRLKVNPSDIWPTAVPIPEDLKPTTSQPKPKVNKKKKQPLKGTLPGGFSAGQIITAAADIRVKGVVFVSAGQKGIVVGKASRNADARVMVSFATLQKKRMSFNVVPEEIRVDVD